MTSAKTSKINSNKGSHGKLSNETQHLNEVYRFKATSFPLFVSFCVCFDIFIWLLLFCSVVIVVRVFWSAILVYSKHETEIQKSSMLLLTSSSYNQSKKCPVVSLKIKWRIDYRKTCVWRTYFQFWMSIKIQPCSQLYNKSLNKCLIQSDTYVSQRAYHPSTERATLASSMWANQVQTTNTCIQKQTWNNSTLHTKPPKTSQLFWWKHVPSFSCWW